MPFDVPVFIDAEGTVVGSAPVDETSFAATLLTLGRIDDRKLPVVVYLKPGGFAGGVLYYEASDCTGMPFVRADTPPVDALIARASVLGGPVIEDAQSGAGTTAYVPFGAVGRHEFGSHAFAFDPSHETCAPTSVIEPSICCIVHPETRFAVPTVTFDLGSFVPPLHLEVRRAELVVRGIPDVGQEGEGR